MPCSPTPDDLADAHTAVRVAARELVLAIRRRDALLDRLATHRGGDAGSVGCGG